MPALTRPAVVSGTVCPQAEDPGLSFEQKMLLTPAPRPGGLTFMITAWTRPSLLKRPQVRWG